jgi:hypothetical protein
MLDEGAVDGRRSSRTQTVVAMVSFWLAPCSTGRCHHPAGACPNPHGHWSGHLGNVAISAGQLVALVGAATLVLERQGLGGRLVTVFALVILVVVAAGLVIQVIGNRRVAASMWQTDYGDEDVGARWSCISRL